MTHKHLPPLLALIVVAVLLLSSCARTIYVPTTTTIERRDTVYKSLQRVDSVIVKDSILITTHNDTTYITKIKWRERVKVRMDTIYKGIESSAEIAAPDPAQHRSEADNNNTTSGAFWCVLSVLLIAGGITYQTFKSKRK